MASHVSQCMAKACMCDTWQAMCVTHGMPCVNMHGSCHAYIRSSHGLLVRARESSKPVPGEARRRGRGGRRREREERKGERKEEKIRGKGRKRGKRKRKRKECCAVSRPGRQRTRNCATRGRFPLTLVILRLGAV